MRPCMGRMARRGSTISTAAKSLPLNAAIATERLGRSVGLCPVAKNSLANMSQWSIPLWAGVRFTAACIRRQECRQQSPKESGKRGHDRR